MFKKQIKCVNCGFLGIHYSNQENGRFGELEEIPPQGREDLSLWVIGNPYNMAALGCLCGQEHIIVGEHDPLAGIPVNEVPRFAERFHSCEYFYHFNAGYSPKQHLELQRQKEQRRFLIIVSILSAAIGAAIATIINLVWS